MSIPMKILVIRHGALGDFVKYVGHMQAIRARYPGARITLLTQGFLVDFARTLNCFDEILVDNRGYRISEWWHVVKRIIADTGFDLIYDLQSSNRTIWRYRLLAEFLTRHAMKWGRRMKSGGIDFYCTPSKPPFVFRMPKIEHFDFVPFPVDLSSCVAARDVIARLPERYVLLIPGCSATNLQKRWPADRYRAISERIASLYGLKTVVIGTRAEAKEAEKICENREDAVNLIGVSSIADIAEIARRAVVTVGNDTGPTHIARLSGARTVMLFTAYDAARAAVSASHVVNLIGEKIEDIEVEAVLNAIRRLLS